MVIKKTNGIGKRVPVKEKTAANSRKDEENE